MDTRSQAQRVVERFGSKQAVVDAARNVAAPADPVVDIGLVTNWVRVRTIHEKYWLKLLIAGRAVGAPLTPYDFVAHTADALTEHVANLRAEASGPAPASSAVPA